MFKNEDATAFSTLQLFLMLIYPRREGGMVVFEAWWQEDGLMARALAWELQHPSLVASFPEFSNVGTLDK